ncbi:Gamma-aminobutyric acid type B receptor subunit 2 [Geodia barretti]|uniref:Gamma-aminobutyric acid type B receptor subunit 2 n=2 Tax=Geodia barretti TaxID=519541 RepID=A0AA35WZG5_GEOBA|nr:Gamma-aminobutyric acid type B receptor subunit 2 [Geodia barretti]
MDRNCVSSTCLRRRRGSTSVGSSGLHYLVCSAVIISVIILQLPSASFAAGSSAGSGEGRDGSSSGSGTAPSSIPLNFIFLSSDNPRLRTSGSIPAVDIALEMVTQSGILGKYKLQYTEALDSQCDRTQSLDMFHEAVRKRKGETFVQNIAIIGAGCSVATLPVAEICHYYNLPMLSWSSTAAELSNRRKFRSNYRLAPSEKLHSPGLAALIRHYQWAQVAMLTQLESLFIEGQRVVKKLLPEVSIVTREFTTDRDPLAVEDFFVKSRDMRVFVLNMYVDFAKKILCEAVRRGMYYPRFLWITPGNYIYTAAHVMLA